MAAAVLENRSKELAGKSIVVTSSGTSSWHQGEGAHRLSQATWEAAGYRYSHTARQFTAESFAGLDLILAMDESNYANILSLSNQPEDRQKVAMLRSFDPEADSIEVPDPWGNELAAYRAVLVMVEAAVTGLLKTLR